LVTPCDAQKVAEAMLFILNDEDSRRKMGIAGRALVRENCGWDSVVRDMLAAYQARLRKNTKG
jgi:glycosyltransferase involved in cell wall biosynthesis